MKETDPPADPSAQAATPVVPPAPAADATPLIAPGERPEVEATGEETSEAVDVADVDADVASAGVPGEPVEAPAPSRPATSAYTPPVRVRRCENCATPLLGDHCYACGQPTKGLVRQFSSILGDFFDTVFQIDSRVFRTLGPLLTRPGRLTLEYFEGHRIRFVSPVRLFVFLSILAFLAAQWSTNFTGDSGIEVDGGGNTNDQLDSADTPERVIAIRDKALAEFERAKREGAKVPGLAIGMDAAAREIRAEADARLKELAAEAAAAPKPPRAPSPPATGKAARTGPPGGPDLPPAGVGPPPGSDGLVIVDDGDNLDFNGKPWDPKTNPVRIGWLPAAANAQINTWMGRAKVNIARLKKDDDKNWIKDAFLGVVPTVLIVLLPLFALLLKVMYLFKRRLYMEHLIVALHSHAFLCLVLLLQSLLALLEGWVAAPEGVVAGVFGFVETVLWAWIPLYLLLMQKRVYGQGWIATGFKFGVVGMAYFFLLLFGGLAALFVTLVRA